MFVTGASKLLHQQYELSCLLIVVDRCFLLQSDLFFQWCFWFNSEGVGRDMWHIQVDECLNVGGPLCVGESGCAVDQIRREVGKMVEGRFECSFGLGGVVSAVHPLKVLFEEALDAEAQSVDAEGLPGNQCRWLDVVGICFEGDLGIGGDMVMFVDAFQQLAEFPFGEQRGGAATEVDGFEGVCGPIGCSSGQFRLHGFQQGGFMVQGGGEVEIAVMAGLFAEWNVEIEAGHGFVGRSMV